MRHVTTELSSLIKDYEIRLSKFSEEEFSAKPLPNKWSKKEVLGHLIDSAQNNLRRFIVGQYQPVPPKITYEQDFWVTANGYQNIPGKDVLTLWKLINRQIVSVLNNMPPENYGRHCDTGSTEVKLRTLEWLAEDYVKHLKHHINQIIPNSFDIVYN